MEISYDPKVDAIYIKLIRGKHQVITHNVDEDIALNLDVAGRMVGIEVLDASKRLDLDDVLSQAKERMQGNKPRITYDPQADAVYVYLTEKIKEPKTHDVDRDIYLDFDEQGRLMGIEVLEASKRLDLDYLMPQAELLGEGELGDNAHGARRGNPDQRD